jgi:hypothetical protein
MRKLVRSLLSEAHWQQWPAGSLQGMGGNEGPIGRELHGRGTVHAQYLGQRPLTAGYCAHTVPGPPLTGDPVVRATLCTGWRLDIWARPRTQFFLKNNSSPSIVDEASKVVGGVHSTG